MAALGIAVLILAHAADYATFLVMVTTHPGGLEAELNPLVVTILEEHGLALLTVAKAAAVLLVASTFLVLVRTRPKVAVAVLVIGVLVGSVGAASNVATIELAG